MQVLTQRLKATTKLQRFLAVVLGVYLIWANIEVTRSAHGAWAADFDNPRVAVGAAQAVFVGRVVEQVGEASTSPIGIPQTQFQVEVLDTVKSVRKVDPNAFESLPANLEALPRLVTIDQYGGHTRDVTGKRVEMLMDDQHLLVPGQTYLLVATYNADHNWYHVLPAGAVLLDNEDIKKATVEKFKKAKTEEIAFIKKSVFGDKVDTVDTPDPPLTTP